MRMRSTRLGGLICLWSLVAYGSAAIAQDEKTAEAQPPAMENATTPQPEPSQDTLTPAEPPTGEAVDAPTTPSAAPTTEQKQSDPHLLAWILKNSGAIGFVILLQSVLAVGLTVKYVLSMQRDKVIPPALVAEFESRIRDKKYQEAYEVARLHSSFLGKVLAAGLAKLSTGYPQAIEAMHEVGEEESMKLEHQLSYLAILGTTGPLLGLLGTVWGMVQSFLVIASSETQPKPSALAGGISNALVTTLEGMVVAIIATVAFMLLKNQAARLVLEVGIVSESLMSRFSTLMRPSRGTSGTVMADPM